MGDYTNFIEELCDELTVLHRNYTFQNPKVTIIIPAYNAEDYIYDCLMSIIKQSLKEIEIIVVNDGSNDNTLSIVSVFAQHDSRIKLINQNNLMAGTARNNAINIAKGKFLTFADSDDRLDESALETLYNTAQCYNCDITICGAYTIRNNKQKKGSYSTQKIPRELKNKNLPKSVILNNIFNLPPVAWAKLYKTDFIKKNNILFQQGCSGEDQIFFISTSLLADSIYILDKNYYYYRKDRPTSLTYSKKKNNNSAVLNFYAIEEFLRAHSNFKNLEFKILNKYFIKAASWLGKCTSSYKKTYFKDLQTLLGHLQKNYPQYYWGYTNVYENDSYLTIKIKIFIYMKLFTWRRSNAYGTTEDINNCTCL